MRFPGQIGAQSESSPRCSPHPSGSIVCWLRRDSDLPMVIRGIAPCNKGLAQASRWLEIFVNEFHFVSASFAAGSSKTAVMLTLRRFHTAILHTAHMSTSPPGQITCQFAVNRSESVHERCAILEDRTTDLFRGSASLQYLS